MKTISGGALALMIAASVTVGSLTADAASVAATKPQKEIAAAPVVPPPVPERPTAGDKPDGEYWTKQCVKSPEGKDVCFVQQFVTAMPQNAILLKVTFSFLGAEGHPRLQITAPLGVQLPAGLKIQIDSAQVMALPYQVCDSSGCMAIAELDMDALSRFRDGKTLNVQFLKIDQKPMTLPVVLGGLANALKSIAP